MNGGWDVMDEKWQKPGLTITDAIIFAQIYAIICFVLFVMILILLAQYLKRTKQEKNAGNIDYNKSK